MSTTKRRRTRGGWWQDLRQAFLDVRVVMAWEVAAFALFGVFLWQTR